MILRFFLMILINSLALFAVHLILGEHFEISQYWGYGVVGAFVGILNSVVRPILSLLALPLVIITFGFFLTLINVFLLYCTQIIFNDILVLGFDFIIERTFSTYLISAALLSFLNWVLHFFLGKK